MALLWECVRPLARTRLKIYSTSKSRPATKSRSIDVLYAPMLSVRCHIFVLTSVESKSPSKPLAIKSVLAKSISSSIIKFASSLKSESAAMTSIETPPSTTDNPLKGTFQNSFDHRAFSNESVVDILVLVFVHSDFALISSKGSFLAWPISKSPKAM